MRKRYLFLAGLLFAAVPAFAQEEPTFTPQDAKVIFTQDFEADWETWESTPVDTIYQLEYYNVTSIPSSPWNAPSLKDSNLVIRTDSVTDGYEGGIVIRNGVVLTGSKDDIANNKYGNDRYRIVDDNTQERKDAFAQWGEDGGQKLFQFVSADRVGTDYSSSSATLYTDDYRRNLFVRLNSDDIEDNTSYRLTFYVKAKETNPRFSPRMHAAVFRGYFNSEKPFTMGLENDNSNYKYNTKIQYDKTEFTGEWEKVTYMTYYLNDSIANYYMLNEYWWSDNWTWNSADNGTPNALKYVKQPDKFFVRLAFQSDSTKFELDNLSLTKSWIGGCEYSGDKMRVDFGYKTNLSDIVAANKKLTNLPAVGVECEVPADQKAELGYDWRIQVWGLKSDDTWQEVYMRSAEYHDDGYMYLFTEFYDDEHSYQFDEYKKVLVTFHNPTDIPDLTLKYTGTGKDVANIFPNALDTTWIKNGKIVPDFFNEIATPNPFVFAGVHSLTDLPPVMQKAPYEEGSFGLKPTQTFSFKFSRDILVDGAGEASEKAIGYVNGVVWTPSFNETDSILTLTCPDDSWKTMSGDYEIKLIQLFGKGTERGANVEMHYHFGAFERDPHITVVAQSDWRAHLVDFTFGNNNTQRPLPDNIYVHSGLDAFVAGTGVVPSPSTKLGLYPLKDDTITVAGVKIPDNCFFYISSRNSNATGNLYSIEHLKAGSYVISFKFAGRSSLDYPMQLKFYAKPEGELENGNDKGFALLEAVANKTVLEPGRYPVQADMGEGGFSQEWKEGTETLSYTFSVASEGDYVFEWISTKSSSHPGVAIGNYWITNAGDLSFNYTTALNSSLEAAAARIALADANADRYTGSIYDALSEKIEYYKIGGAFDALQVTEPSVWDAAKKEVNDATNLLKLRMDTVDIYYTAEDNAKAKVASLESQEGFKTMPTLAALSQLIADNASYSCPAHSGDEIVAAAKVYDDAVKAVDDRIAAINNYNTLLESIVALKDAADAQTGLDEYATMVEAYDSYKDTPIYTAEDDVFNAAYNGLIAGKNAYVFKADYVIAKTRQVKELFALAEELGYDFADLGGKTEVKAIIDELVDDDPDLTSFLREAAIMQVYQLYADGDADILDSLDVSALIPNYFLYNEAEVGRDLDQSSAGVWRIIKSKDNTTAFPGWTVNVNGTVYPGQEALDWPVDGHVFIGGLHYATNTTGSVSTKVEGLPVAYYSVGFDMIQNNLSNSSFTVVTDSTNTNIKGSSYKFTAHKTVIIDDSVRVTKDSPMTLTYAVTSGSGSGHVGVNRAVLILVSPDADADYDALLKAQEELLTIVDANKALEAGVEYYTVGGMKLDAPKSGQILIRRTTQNGKVVVDKVLIK